MPPKTQKSKEPKTKKSKDPKKQTPKEPRGPRAPQRPPPDGRGVPPDPTPLKPPSVHPDVPELFQIRRHRKYFPLLPEFPMDFPTEVHGQAIECWTRFRVKGQATSLLCPLFKDTHVTGEMVAYSSIVWCQACFQWRKYGNSVTHYKEHAMLHIDESLPPLIVEAEEVRLELVANHLRRGDPFCAMDSLRRLSVGRDLPNRRQIVSIINLLHLRVVAALHEEAEKAKFVNLAIDGWTDACTRRYQGVTARFVSPTGKVTSAVLTLKEVLEVHESGETVRAVAEHVVQKYEIADKVLNICSDRDSKNIAAFRTNPLPDGCEWLPCAAHWLNLILNRFYKNAADVVDPIFDMAASLRKRPGFFAFLVQRHVTNLRLPAYSRIRWYSSARLFMRLQEQWRFIAEYCAAEKLDFPALQLFAQVKQLSSIANSFQKAETALEGDRFGSGAHFIPKLLSILHNIEKFRVLGFAPAADAVKAYVAEFKSRHPREYCMYLMATFFAGSGIHFAIGNDGPCTCTHEEFDLMRGVALELIELEIAREEGVSREVDPSEEPPSDDFTTPRAQNGIRMLAFEQFECFKTERSDFATNWWKVPRQSMRHIAAAAEKVASWLFTSCSVERAFWVAGAIASKRRMRIAGHNVHAQLMVQANWSIAKKFLAEILQLGPEGWNAEEGDRCARTGIDLFAGDLMMEIEPVEEEELAEERQPPPADLLA
jgi:hypothetical protein